MTPKVFLDTGFLIALELLKDQNHQIARDHWQQLALKKMKIVTTSYVFDEVVTFLNSRGHHSKAIKVGTTLLQSPSVQLIHVDEQLFAESWTMFLKYSDKQFSLTDCVSFTVMRRENIESALAFDHHFTQAGFVRLP